MLRAAAAIMIFLLAGPSLLFEQVRRPYNFEQRIRAERLEVPAARFGPLEVVEAWYLSSPHDGFGGVSAMALTGERQFLMLGDAGNVMQFRLAAEGDVSDVAIGPLGPAPRRKQAADVESMVRDPERGLLWVGYEGSNRIVRYAADLRTVEAEVRPRAMRRWLPNGGAEAMAPLRDGRALILSERTRTRGLGTAALLFAGDPTMPGIPAPLVFGYRDWGMGRLTDAAALPDGRVLLLHRQVDAWLWFTSTLAIGDPATIRAGQSWTARPLAGFGWPVLSENFEAIAVVPHPRGLSIWLASDDNFSPLQRTLLVHLLLRAEDVPPR